MAIRRNRWPYDYNLSFKILSHLGMHNGQGINPHPPASIFVFDGVVQ